MPFGLWPQMVPRNDVLDVGPQVLRCCHGAIFWLSMGYNFGCVIASGTNFDTSLGFRVKLFDENTAEIVCLRVVATATNCGMQIAISGFV